MDVNQRSFAEAEGFRRQEKVTRRERFHGVPYRPYAKTVQTESGPVALQVPRDGDGDFAPQLVKKGQRRLEGFLGGAHHLRQGRRLVPEAQRWRPVQLRPVQRTAGPLLPEMNHMVI